MKNKFQIALLATLLLSAIQLKAQDKMILRAKPDTLYIKIIELGVDEIRYKTWPVDESMPIMVEKKDRVKKVIFANGTVMKFAEDEFSNAANYANQRKMAIKLDLFSPIKKVLSGSFEYSVKPGVSAELGIGVIGVGSYNSDVYDFTESNGGFIRLGVKFINQPDYYLKGMRYTHILKGGYLRPELMLLYHENTGTGYSYYGGGYYGSQVDKVVKVNGYAFFMNFGKQWVFNDIFCVDFFIGPGIGAKNVEYKINGATIPGDLLDYTDVGGFGFSAFTTKPGSIAFCMQSGLKLGVLIGSKGNKDKN